MNLHCPVCDEVRWLSGLTRRHWGRAEMRLTSVLVFESSAQRVFIPDHIVGTAPGVEQVEVAVAIHVH